MALPSQVATPAFHPKVLGGAAVGAGVGVRRLAGVVGAGGNGEASMPVQQRHVDGGSPSMIIADTMWSHVIPLDIKWVGNENNNRIAHKNDRL